MKKLSINEKIDRYNEINRAIEHYVIENIWYGIIKQPQDGHVLYSVKYVDLSEELKTDLSYHGNWLQIPHLYFREISGARMAIMIDSKKRGEA